MVVAGRTANELVVFAIIIVALVLFISEVIPNDVTTIGVIASLVVLEP